MTGKVLLEAKDLCKKYGEGEAATVALNAVSLTVYENEFLVVLGNSGSGKSTLLNMLGGMDVPDAGEVLVNGENVCKATEKKRTRYRKTQVGFVFQSFNLIADLTAKENVSLVSDNETALKMLSVVGLSKKADKYPSQLSGGEQQRVSIARALAKKGDLLLCDEPTGALDYETGKQVLLELEKLHRELGKTIVLVTHTKEIARIADCVIRMKNGEIVEEFRNPSPVSVADIDW